MIRLMICCIMALFLAACGGAPSAAPTEAVTPQPTVVPTLAPVGFPSNPLQLLIVPADPDAAADLETDLETILLQATNVSIDVVIVEQPTEIVQAICTSFRLEENIAAGWVDGVTYATLFEQRCGAGTVQYARNDDTREMGVLLANRNFTGSSVAVLSQRPICRISRTDYHSWVALSLLMYSVGIDPATLETIDFDDTDTLLQAIDDGDCGSGMVAQAVWDSWNDENENRLDENSFTVGMPLGILVLPFAAPESARLAITAGLSDFDEAAVLEAIVAASAPEADATAEATDEVAAVPSINIPETLAAFFGDGTFASVQANDFDAWLAYLETIGLTFTTSGE